LAPKIWGRKCRLWVSLLCNLRYPSIISSVL